MQRTPTARTERVIALAEACLGTPFRHQGRVPGVGLDCVGVVIHVYNALGLPFYVRSDYGVSPNPRRMIAELETHLTRIPIPEARVGDVLHMAWRNLPQHLAILTPVGILHGYQTAGRVVEHPMDAAWRSRVRGAYRFPEVA